MSEGEETLRGKTRIWGRLYTGQGDWACCGILSRPCLLVSLTYRRPHPGQVRQEDYAGSCLEPVGEGGRGRGTAKVETLKSSCGLVTGPSGLQQLSLPCFVANGQGRALAGKSWRSGGPSGVPLWSQSRSVWAGLAGLVLHSKPATHCSVEEKMTQPC